MEKLFELNWQELFMPSVSLVELVVRGTIVYLLLFLLMRLFLKRAPGAVGIADLLMIVIIADASQNALTHDYKSITDGFILVGTILFWNYMIDWLGYRFPWFQKKLVSPPPLLLIKNGQMLWRNMRRELITEDELMSQVRRQGINKLEEVKEAFMEGNGQISVIKEELSGNDRHPKNEYLN